LYGCLVLGVVFFLRSFILCSFRLGKGCGVACVIGFVYFMLGYGFNDRLCFVRGVGWAWVFGFVCVVYVAACVIVVMDYTGLLKCLVSSVCCGVDLT